MMSLPSRRFRLWLPVAFVLWLVGSYLNPGTENHLWPVVVAPLLLPWSGYFEFGAAPSIERLIRSLEVSPHSEVHMLLDRIRVLTYLMTGVPYFFAVGTGLDHWIARWRKRAARLGTH